MAGLCWMAVALAFFLSAENTLAVDLNRLAEFVNGILGEYGPEGMFSLAVSIPEDQNRRPMDILKKVYESDPSNKVLEKLNNNEVYIGSRVVAAKVLKQARGAEHAESRVVDHLNDLFNPNKKNDLLFFYDYASPQTHPERLIKKINDLNKWNSYVFVFSKTFKPSKGQSNTEGELSGALTRSQSKIGLDNIFHCDKKAGGMQCISCYSNNQVAFTCVSDYSQPGPSRSRPQQGSRGTAQGVESRRRRYKRSGGFSLGGGWSLGGESVHQAGWSPSGGGSRSGTSGFAGGLGLSTGFGPNRGGGHGAGLSLSGGLSLGGQGVHSAGWSPSGGSSQSATRGNAGGFSLSAGLSHDGRGGLSGGSSLTGGWTLSGEGRHTADWSPSGGSSESTIRGHGIGLSLSSGFGRNRKRKRRIIIRAE